MEIQVSNDVTIINPSQEIIEWCKQNLVLPNPDYYKKQQMGKWCGNTPSDIWLYYKTGNELHLPFGCINAVWAMYKDDGIPFKARIKPVNGFYSF